MKFEWDKNKDIANQRKHGIAFSTAKKVFFDERRIVIPDNLHSLEETRHITIGRAKKILFVVYTERHHDDGDAIRLISARRANETERRLYYERPGISH